MNTKPSTPRPPRRRWLQFSLRTLLVVMLAFGVWLGWKVNKAREQREIVEAIHAAGGDAWYDYECREDAPAEERPWPTWLENAVGRDFLYEVEGVAFSFMDDQAPSSSDQSTRTTALEQASRLPRLRWLKLRNVRSPELVAKLAAFSQIQELQLWVCPVYDGDINDDLAAVGRLQQIERMEVFACQLGAKGLDHFRPLAGLRELNLDYTQLTLDDIFVLKQALPDCQIAW